MIEKDEYGTWEQIDVACLTAGDIVRSHDGKRHCVANIRWNDHAATAELDIYKDRADRYICAVEYDNTIWVEV